MHDMNNEAHYGKQTPHVTAYNITDNILPLNFYLIGK